MFAAISSDWRTRPWWMNFLFYFCLYMTFIYMPFDMFFKPVAEDEEIWFGFTLYGWWAKATEPLHWLIYGAGAYGFWKMRRWMWPWAAVYAAQVVIAMVVWNILNERGSAVGVGIAGVLFLVLTIALWRAKDTFNTSATPASPSVSAADP